MEYDEEEKSEARKKTPSKRKRHWSRMRVKKRMKHGLKK
jgi:hypothetical protein